MKFFFILLLVLGFNPKLFSQNNSFGISYTPAMTRVRMTDVREFSDNVFTDLYKVWYDTKKPKISAYGYNFGFSYKRKVKNKFLFECAIYHTVLKTQSGNFFQVNGVKEYHPDYGGIEYFMKYRGLEVPINVHYQFYKKRQIDLNITAGISFNIMGDFTVQDYLIKRISGEKNRTLSYSRINDAHFRYYFSKLREIRSQRLGISLGMNLNYQITKNFNFSASPILKYYSNALEKSYSLDALRADAFFWGLQSQININF